MKRAFPHRFSPLSYYKHAIARLLSQGPHIDWEDASHQPQPLIGCNTRLQHAMFAKGKGGGGQFYAVSLPPPLPGLGRNSTPRLTKANGAHAAHATPDYIASPRIIQSSLAPRRTAPLPSLEPPWSGTQLSTNFQGLLK